MRMNEKWLVAKLIVYEFVFFDARSDRQPMDLVAIQPFTIQMALKILRDMVAERGGGRGKGSGYGGKQVPTMIWKILID